MEIFNFDELMFNLWSNVSFANKSFIFQQLVLRSGFTPLRDRSVDLNKNSIISPIQGVYQKNAFEIQISQQHYSPRSPIPTGHVNQENLYCCKQTNSLWEFRMYSNAS